ncbi:MAG TPA: TIGR04282 family arsenosugar biosynthesis glycosyltransferase [Rhizomicrobium sp.]|nr:TIGR04282 family arsenosugar biosynthesis glycosyltransferase [Rhizomicrobium sp.]
MTPCRPPIRRNTVLIIFAKAPVAGRVKTRLARGLGVARATMWYRRALAHTISLAKNSRVPFCVALRQPSGDLGRRMGLVAKAAKGPSIIIGCDIPELSVSILREAADAVSRFDLVIGPAQDGGYYLVGLKSPAHAFRLYEHVRWSGEFALADTLKNVPRHWRVHMLKMLRDVDVVEDLKPHSVVTRACG